MSRCTASRWCGAFSGLALLLSAPLDADETTRDAVRRELRDESYILVEDGDRSWLYRLSGSTGADTVPAIRPAAPDVTDKALSMTRSVDARTRVRGLTLLAAETSSAAYDAALALISDPVAAVREEAFQLLLDHPAADTNSLEAIARTDASPRVREAVAELLAEQAGD